MARPTIGRARKIAILDDGAVWGGLADAVRRGLRERARQADGTYVPLEQSEAKE